MHVLRLPRNDITRSRRVNACITCRLRKIKCDRDKPDCQRCTAAGRVCRYAKDGKLSEKTAVEDVSEIGSQPASFSLSEGEDLSPLLLDSRIYDTVSNDQDTSTTSLAATLGQIRDSNPQQLHDLLRWYLSYCDFILPLQTSQNLQELHDNWLSDTLGDINDLPLLIAAYSTAAMAVEACCAPIALTTTSKHWRNLATRLLVSFGYPESATMTQIHTALLLAVLTLQETPTGMHILPVALLVRVAQSNRLHQEPIHLDTQASICEYRRLLFWHVHTLDVGFAITHRLPPLLSPLSFDVAQVPFDANAPPDPTKIFQHLRTRGNLLLAQILDEVYGPRPIARRCFQILELHATQLSDDAEEAALKLKNSIHDDNSTCNSDGQPCPSPAAALAHCVAHCIRLLAYRASYSLHAPYLQTPTWPLRSRAIALTSSKTYLQTYLSLHTSLALLPFRWLLRLHDVYQPLALLLRDLIANPASAEAGELVGIVEEGFAELFDPGEEAWGRLGELRGRAWGGLGVGIRDGAAGCGASNDNGALGELSEQGGGMVEELDGLEGFEGLEGLEEFGGSDEEMFSR